MKKFRLALIFVGRASDNYVREGCRLYEDRIRVYADLETRTVPEERIPYKGKRDFILDREGQRIREKITDGAFSVALDEKGKLLNSESFARSLEVWGAAGSREIDFLVGGPYGMEERLKSEAGFRLSLSQFTLPHGLARIVVLEQIYRAFTLLRGVPYHK
ncbi:MAG TPA: 23S rRNA (pseudouridine(1915)-N(3))-methyltransferase RlmH [Thermodesulfobacteriota bacterium]|nr:23S rRNA (pseudouridine(1915)-N(3))-methyltransferase RlmH [Thermodesulfobacteriota bacterium]